MVPTSLLIPHDDLLYPVQTSPELRRMDMYNRARRDEMNALLYNVNPRQAVAFGGRTRNTQSTSKASKLLNGLRDGIGHALITAGNRIQSAA